jgi:cytochrome oxidase Cu insertion factor (SCO1/SenC/PrrC family)
MLNMLFKSAILAGFAALAGPAQPPSGQPQSQRPQPEPTLKVGDKAPEFALQGSDGKVHKLSDYKGKTVVLAWFPKAFTGG